ncbi:putative ribonuclease H-like domain-containing protein [Tanacetum coccineum]
MKPPTKISQALDDESWVEAMQEELLQFKIKKVWILVDSPSGKKAIGTKWVYRNKKDERGIVVRNKARLMDVKSAFLYDTIEEEVYVCQPPAWYETLSTYLLDNGFHRGQIDKILFIKRLKGDILLVQVYVDDIIFGSIKKSLCDEFEQIMHNRFQMSSMGELTFFLGLQVKQKEDGIFISQDKCQLGQEIHNIVDQFLGSRLISWQCKKQTVVANSTTKAEYIAASHCYGQVLWIQNQMLDYGFNFMQTKIHVDNESAICVVKNPVYHSKTKHIEIRHHFIRDSYEKRLIEMVKIHTDHNVADLLTKAFDVSRFNFLVASIGKRGRDTKIPQSGGPPIKVGDEAVHKELGDRMERAATTASSFEAEQDSDAQTRFEAASKSPMTHLSQELTHLEVGRTKSEGSEGFHQIIDFLNASHIQYALTENPTIYVSFIKQFWRTATARTSANGEVELTATIDGQVKTITEASLRRHLKLEDNGGVTTLPNLEIFEQLALMGAPETSPSRITSSPSLSPQHTPVITSLEAELAQTKQTYGTALTKLIKKVKNLEQTVKSTQAKRRFRIVASDDEEGLEDPSKEGRKIIKIDQDPSISLVHDEGTSWIQEDIEIQEKVSDDIEVVLEEEEPTELVEDQGSGEKGEKEVSTVDAEHSTVISEVIN